MICICKQHTVSIHIDSNSVLGSCGILENKVRQVLKGKRDEPVRLR